MRVKRPIVALLAAVGCGATILTNTWDFPAFTLLIGLSIVIVGPLVKEQIAPPLISRIALAAGVVMLALLVASPFLLHLQSAANPPQPLPQPASPLREWAVDVGAHPVVLVALRGFYRLWAQPRLARDAARDGDRRWRRRAVCDVGHNRGSGRPRFWCLPILIASAGFAVAGLFGPGAAGRYACVLALCGLFALAWSEATWAGFLGDANHVGIDDFKRQDTVFKFGLQAWMLWGTASAAGLWLAMRDASPGVRGAVVAVLAPLGLVMFLGNLSFTLHRVRLVPMWQAQRAGTPNWLAFDAWDAWAHLAPPEKAAARWLLDQAGGG